MAPATEPADVREVDWPYRTAVARAFRLGPLHRALVLGWWHRPSGKLIPMTTGLLSALQGRVLPVTVPEIRGWENRGPAEMGLHDSSGVVVLEDEEDDW